MRVIIRTTRNFRRRQGRIAGGIACVMAVALLMWSRPLPGLHPRDMAPGLRPADLVVSEAAFVGPAGRRTVAGVLENRSGRLYTKIQITFSLVDSRGDTVGSAAAVLDRVPSHQAARFEASPVVPTAVEVVLQHIGAEPPPAGTP